jgi:hypothetical protein
MPSPRFRVFAQLTPVVLCCVALTLIGCRRDLEPPAETVGAAPEEKPAIVTEITSDLFVAYPGAEVDTATLKKNPTRLLQTVDATPVEVIEYYRRYYHGRGWADGPHLDQETFFSQSFVGDKGWVTVTIQAPEAGTRKVSVIYTERP